MKDRPTAEGRGGNGGSPERRAGENAGGSTPAGNGASPETGRIENRVEGSRRRRDMPENLWMQCTDCGKLIYRPRVQEKLYVCPD